MTFGQHRGEHVLRRCARRWWRRNLIDDIAGDAVCNLVAIRRIKL
jgi:hypothetical protein